MHLLIEKANYSIQIYEKIIWYFLNIGGYSSYGDAGRMFYGLQI